MSLPPSVCCAGIFNSDGDVWRNQRKLATHMFSRREFTDTIMSAFRKHGAELDAELAWHAASGEPLDLQALFFRFTLVRLGDRGLLLGSVWCRRVRVLAHRARVPTPAPHNVHTRPVTSIRRHPTRRTLWATSRLVTL